MKFLFDCDDEILLPKAYSLVDKIQEFSKKIGDVKEPEIGGNKTDKIKAVLRNIMVEYPKETSELFKEFWVLEDNEKAPNALKTMSVLFSNENAIDFFTSALPSILQLSNVLLKK